MLTQAGIEFETIVSTVEEVITKNIPSEVVEELAYQKAMDVAEQVLKNCDEECLVIGADTIVTIDGKIMGKPKDAADAEEMLQILQGKVHQVFTGVTFVIGNKDKKKHIAFHEKTDVYFYPMSEEEVKGYVASGEPFGKAGSYGIQGKSAVYIEKINGDYNNVVGLPLAKVYQEAKKAGLDLMK